MASGGDTKPPAQQSLLLGDTVQTATAWLAFFESVSKRLDACEARLLVCEQRLLSLEIRLAAAGIP